MEEKECDENKKIREIKSYDNKYVTGATTFASANPVQEIESFDQKMKKTVTISQPNAIAQYNQSISEVDKLDQLISYYRTNIRNNNYYHKFFFLFLRSKCR